MKSLILGDLGGAGRVAVISVAVFAVPVFYVALYKAGGAGLCKNVGKIVMRAFSSVVQICDLIRSGSVAEILFTMWAIPILDRAVHLAMRCRTCGMMHKIIAVVMRAIAIQPDIGPSHNEIGIIAGGNANGIVVQVLCANKAYHAQVDLFTQRRRIIAC